MCHAKNTRVHLFKIHIKDETDYFKGHSMSNSNLTTFRVELSATASAYDGNPKLTTVPNEDTIAGTHQCILKWSLI